MTLVHARNDGKPATWRIYEWAAVLMLLLPAMVSHAGDVPRRFPVTTEMVITAMRYRQLPVEGVQVRLSAPVTSSSTNPMLDIQTMTKVDAHNAQLLIACRVRTECLPFYVAATWPGDSSGMTIPESLNHRNNAPQGVSAALSVSGALHPGSSATLVIEDDKVHIRMRVICLDGGVPGDKVRVSTPDHKAAYKAEIVAPNLLKGSF